MRKRFVLLFFLISFFSLSCNKKQGGYYSVDGLTQGTTYHIVLELSDNDISYRDMCDSIDYYLELIDWAVSGYNKKSILSRFNDNPYKLFEDLGKVNGEKEGARELLCYKIFYENFLIGKQISAITEGVVDVSGAPIFDIWGFGFKEGTEVTQRMIDSVKQFVGIDKFVATEKIISSSEPLTQSVFKLFEDIEEFNDKSFTYYKIVKKDSLCRLNFNAIAQGYTVDFIAEKFNRNGIKNFLIEVGGEVYAQGVNAQGGKWRVGIDKPIDGNNSPGKYIQEIIEITNKGLVTSGDYRKFYLKDGKKIGHTINPQLGYPVENNLVSATLLSDNATIADAFATYFVSIGLEKSEEFLSKYNTDSTNKNKIQALLIYSENESLKVKKIGENF